MTPSERARIFRQATNQVVKDRTRLMRSTREDLVQLLKAAERSIAAILAGEPTDYQRWSLPRLQADVKRVMGEFGEKGSARIGTAAGTAWQQGQDLIDKPIAAAMPSARVVGLLPHLEIVQLAAMRAFMVDRIKDIGVQAANRITAELGLVMIGARSPSEAISAVTQILGEPSRARATTIVRTELGRAFSTAAQARAMEAAKILPGLQKQWRRSGKLHPRLEHDLIDGQIRDVDKPFTVTPFGQAKVELMFPRDPKAPAKQTINCGCDSIPYMASWEVKHPGRTPGSPLLDDDGDTLQQVLARNLPRVPVPA